MPVFLSFLSPEFFASALFMHQPLRSASCGAYHMPAARVFDYFSRFTAAQKLFHTRRLFKIVGQPDAKSRSLESGTNKADRT